MELSATEQKHYDLMENWKKKNPDKAQERGFEELKIGKSIYYKALKKLKGMPTKRKYKKKAQMQTLVVPEPSNVILMVVPVSEVGSMLKSILGGL